MCDNATYRSWFREERKTVRKYIDREGNEGGQVDFIYRVTLDRFDADLAGAVTVLNLLAAYDDHGGSDPVVDMRIVLKEYRKENCIRHAIAAFDEMIWHIEHTEPGKELFEAIYSPKFSAGG